MKSCYRAVVVEQFSAANMKFIDVIIMMKTVVVEQFGPDHCMPLSRTQL